MHLVIFVWGYQLAERIPMKWIPAAAECDHESSINLIRNSETNMWNNHNKEYFYSIGSIRHSHTCRLLIGRITIKYVIGFETRPRKLGFWAHAED